MGGHVLPMNAVHIQNNPGNSGKASTIPAQFVRVIFAGIVEDIEALP